MRESSLSHEALSFLEMFASERFYFNGVIEFQETLMSQHDNN